MLDKELTERAIQKMTPIWTLDEAIKLIREIQPEMHNVKYAVSLGGSVLNEGESYKDLDLIINPFYPEEVGEEFIAARAKLETLGFTLVRNREEVANGHDEYAIVSNTNKWIEEWSFNGKRVDIFFLK